VGRALLGVLWLPVVGGVKPGTLINDAHGMKKSTGRAFAPGTFLRGVSVKPLLQVKFIVAGGALVTVDGQAESLQRISTHCSQVPILKIPMVSWRVNVTQNQC
jgi:hypothetical protein